MASLVTLDEIRRAQAALPPQVRRTPLLRSDGLSEQLGGEVRLKCENLQVTGAYKVRAAFTVLNRLTPEQKLAGAALSSSGNFAAAFALMGRLLGVPTHIVMMEKTSPFKVAKTRKLGGEVVFCENRFEARIEVLEELRARGITVVHHGDEPNVIRGHGTLGLEMLDQWPQVDTVLVPVSIGGLIAGVATAVKAVNPQARVIGVQPTGSCALHDSLRAQEIRRVKVETICDALTAEFPSQLNFDHARAFVDDVVLVDDTEVKRAMAWLFEHEKLVAEPGGAVTVAALRKGKVSATGRNVIALISGGNVPVSELAAWAAEVAGLAVNSTRAAAV